MIIQKSQGLAIRVEILPPLRICLFCRILACQLQNCLRIRGTVRVLHANTGVEIFLPLRGHNNTFSFVVFSPRRRSRDGSKIVSAAPFEFGTQAPGWRHFYCKATRRLLILLYSGNGSKIVSKSYDNTIRVWDPSSEAANIEISPSQQSEKTGYCLGKIPVENDRQQGPTAFGGQTYIRLRYAIW